MPHYPGEDYLSEGFIFTKAVGSEVAIVDLLIGKALCNLSSSPKQPDRN